MHSSEAIEFYLPTLQYLMELPFRQIVTLDPPEETERPFSENYFHQLLMEDARFDLTKRADLGIDIPGTRADSKPAVHDPLDPPR